MSQPIQHRFLIVDDNSDSRQLLVKTIVRKYPTAVVHEVRHGDAAVLIAREPELTAIVSHRTYDYDGETLVALFRRVNPAVPIIMVSGYDRAERAKAAGANAFLNYDQWLMIGTVIGEVLERRGRAQPLGPAPATDEMSASPA